MWLRPGCGKWHHIWSYVTELKCVLRVPNECWPLSAWKIVVGANALKMYWCMLGPFILKCLNVHLRYENVVVVHWSVYIFFLLMFRNEGLKSWTKCTLNNGSIWMKTSIQVLTANSFLLRMHFSVKMDHIDANKYNIVTMGLNFMLHMFQRFSFNYTLENILQIL